MPFTCASSHSVNSLWFALSCKSFAHDPSVVYFVKTENLINFSPINNVLKHIEDEIALTIKPVEFS